MIIGVLKINNRKYMKCENFINQLETIGNMLLNQEEKFAKEIEDYMTDLFVLNNKTVVTRVNFEFWHGRQHNYLCHIRLVDPIHTVSKERYISLYFTDGDSYYNFRIKDFPLKLQMKFIKFFIEKVQPLLEQPEIC